MRGEIIMGHDDFYTFRGYMQRDSGLLTPSMEDYVEMIYRLSLHSGFTRINELAASLNVQPPSATKMVRKLSEISLVNYEKYGILTLTDNGTKIGKALLERHNIIENFLKIISPNDNVLEQTEKLEHSISTDTLECLNKFVQFLKEQPHIIQDFYNYSSLKK
jgi:Mn-dependent DtxR family transcriptional regulator